MNSKSKVFIATYLYWPSFLCCLTSSLKSDLLVTMYKFCSDNQKFTNIICKSRLKEKSFILSRIVVIKNYTEMRIALIIM